MSEYNTSIPESLRVGNTVEFAYKAYNEAGTELVSGDSYTLYWVLSNATNQMSATTQTQIDQGFFFQVVTSGWTAGDYTSVLYADNGTLRYEQTVASVTVLPSLDSAVESRTTYKQIADALDAAILGQATSGQLAMSIAGRSIQRMSMEDLLKAKVQFDSLVASEENAQKMKDGKLPSNTIQVRLI